ncbi:MAG: hypothetical protein AB7Q29_05475 [Vicinamibacterales bacterium]
MISAFRRTRAASALSIAMLACMVWISISALLHDESDDVLCSGVVLQHDHSAHRVGADPASTPSPDHCFVCHSHSLRSLASALAVWSPGAGEIRLLSRLQADTGITLARRQHARAPPLA